MAKPSHDYFCSPNLLGFSVSRTRRLRYLVVRTLFTFFFLSPRYLFYSVMLLSMHKYTITLFVLAQPIVVFASHCFHT